jgi:hypothetical protein
MEPMTAYRLIEALARHMSEQTGGEPCNPLVYVDGKPVVRCWWDSGNKCVGIGTK